MDPIARRITNRYSIASAAVAFLVHPIPALDEVVVVPVHYALCLRLARRRKFPLAKLPWRQIQRIVWYGAAARTALSLALAPIPIASGAANYATAVALTEYLSRYLDDAMSNPDRPPREISVEEIRKLFARAQT